MNTDQRSSTIGNQAEHVRGWFIGRLPEGWFAGPPEVMVDREEITVIGTLPQVESGRADADPAGPGPQAPAAASETGVGQQQSQSAGEAGEASDPASDSGGAAGALGEDGASHGASQADVSAMALGRSRRFREETREARIAVAREAEALFGRKVSWGVVCEGQKVMFTTLSVPVMTRLRQSERQVLDTLVDAGVARSRSEALAWCARLVGQHEDSWLADLRAALRHVAEVRAQGPRS